MVLSFIKEPTSAEDRARKTIIKCLNAMHADVELPATIASTYLLGIPDHYTSHLYAFIFTKYFLSALKPIAQEKHMEGILA